MQKSLADKVSTALAPLLRKNFDVIAPLTGSGMGLLRITQDKDSFTGKNRDVLGDFVGEDFAALLYTNMYIKYPQTKLEVFADRDSNGKFSLGATDLMQFLPVEVMLQFKGDDNTKAPINIVFNDLIVDYLVDEFNNVVPMVWRVTKVFAGFQVKNIISRTCEVTLERGELREDFQHEIDKFIEKVKLSL